MPEEKLTESQLPSMPLVSPAPSHKAFPCQIKILFLCLNPEQTSSNLCSRVLGCKSFYKFSSQSAGAPASGPWPHRHSRTVLAVCARETDWQVWALAQSLHRKGSQCMVLSCFVFIVLLSSVWFALQQNERFFFYHPVFFRVEAACSWTS